MNVTKEQFVREVINRLAEEHEVSAAEFEHLVPQIEEAYATEGVAITPDELNDIIHGTVSPDAMVTTEKYPLVDAIALAPYALQSVIDRSSQVEKEQEEMEEDDEEDDEEEDAESEDSDEEDDDADD